MYLILSLSSVTIYLSKHTSYWKTPYIKSVHLSDFCCTKGSPFDAICDFSVNLNKERNLTIWVMP